ncbi:MAG: hypothetical protein ACM3PR_00305 [Bacteroidales bacterium]
MNYLKEIIAFYDWMETHPQSKCSIALWHALMNMNNKCCWSKNFRVPIGALLLKAGLTKKEFIVARKALVRCGRITLFEHSPNEVAIYSINPFFDENGNPVFYEEEANNYVEILKVDAPLISTDKKRCNTKKKSNAEPVRDLNFITDIGNTSEDISDDSDKNQPEILYGKYSSEKSSVSKNAQKNEEIGQMVVPNEAQNEPIAAPPTVPIINKLNETKLNKTKLNCFEEDKSSSSPGDFQKLNLKDIFDEYNLLCTRLPKAKIFSKRRSQEVGARYREHGEDAMHDVIRLAAESDFLSGNSKSGWRPNFDWIFMPTNFVKILEGYYGNKLPNSEFAVSQGSDSHRNRYAEEYIGKPSPIELLEQSYKDMFGDENFDY